MIQSLISLLILVRMLPYESKILNGIEIFNELCVMFIIYNFLFFSDYVNDFNIAYKAGWGVCLIVLILMVVNIALIIAENIMIIIKYLIKVIRKKKYLK